MQKLNACKEPKSVKARVFLLLGCVTLKIYSYLCKINQYALEHQRNISYKTHATSIAALKLPLCKVKKDFADEHGIPQSNPVQQPRRPSFNPGTTSAPSVVEPPRRSQSSFNREGDTLIVTPSRTVTESSPAAPALKSTLLDRFRNPNRQTSSSSANRDACKGRVFGIFLIFSDFF